MFDELLANITASSASPSIHLLLARGTFGLIHEMSRWGVRRWAARPWGLSGWGRGREHLMWVPHPHIEARALPRVPACSELQAVGQEGDRTADGILVQTLGRAPLHQAGQGVR